MDDLNFMVLSFGARGYTCAQILILLALEARGEENPHLVRAMAGLAHGCGEGAAVCGAMSGAASVLGLYAGKGSDSERQSERLDLMLAQLNEWFREKTSVLGCGITCEEIVGPDTDPKIAMQACGSLVEETYRKLQEILMENGFDPAGSTEL